MTDEHKKYLKVMTETPGIYGPMIDAVRAALAEIKRLEARAVPPWSAERPTAAGKYLWRSSPGAVSQFDELCESDIDDRDRYFGEWALIPEPPEVE